MPPSHPEGEMAEVSDSMFHHRDEKRLKMLTANDEEEKEEHVPCQKHLVVKGWQITR